jgi:hypothetical protein
MSTTTEDSKINIPVETLVKALVEAHVNVSINSLIKALADANINVVNKNDKPVDISKNIPIVLKTEIANDIEPKANYVDTATGISPPLTENIQDSTFLLNGNDQIDSTELSNVITEALNSIKQRKSPVSQEPPEDIPSEQIKRPVIDIPSPKPYHPSPQLPPQSPRIPLPPPPQPQQVYYQHQQLPPQYLHPIRYIIQPIIQPIIQYVHQPVQYLMQQFQPQQQRLIYR